MMLKIKKNEHGAVMLEGVFGVFVSIIVMAFMLSFGFYLYQQTMVNIVANEIAEQVSHTYKFRGEVSDNSYISSDNISDVGRYRYLCFSGKYESANENKAITLASTRLSKTAFAKAKGQPTVEIETVRDDLGRMHYEVTLTQEYEFMMGDILKLIGLNGVETLSSTVYVESVDVSNYINTVKMANYGLDKLSSDMPFLDLVDSVIKMMNSIYNIFT